MLPTRQGSLRLFRFAGIEVFLHWTWFLVPVYFYYNAVQFRGRASFLWTLLECLALFAIVLAHEFGHSLACRQVGGQADEIYLWPLGGVALVAPPQRPGAMLWSIAAGPLVNVLLVMPLFAVTQAFHTSPWGVVLPRLARLCDHISSLNGVLLFFNLLPIYPLDGGQILRSLLWFVLGRARSLMVTTIIGFAGVALLLLLAVVNVRQPLFLLLCGFILLNCWGGLKYARVLTRLARLPRRPGFACPSCRQPPVLGAYWHCSRCLKAFDTFETHATCPYCGTLYPITQCLDCGIAHPVAEWTLLAGGGPPPRG